MKKIIGVVVGLSLFVPLVSFAAAPVTQVTASADAGSTISPSGVTSVATGVTQGFGIGADAGFHLVDVSFDGISQGVVSNVNVTGDGVDHSINVTSENNGGGSLLFCSGPLAPGYNVSLVGGGCGQTTSYVPFGHALGTLFGGTDVCLFYSGCMVKN